MWNKIGQIMSWLIVALFLASIFYNIFGFIFHGRLPTYGIRGDVYIYE